MTLDHVRDIVEITVALGGAELARRLWKSFRAWRAEQADMRETYRTLKRSLIDRAALAVEFGGFGKVDVNTLPSHCDDENVPQLTHVSPEILRSIRESGLDRDASEFYHAHKHELSPAQMLWKMEGIFHKRILLDLCRPHRMSDLQCLLLLMQVAKDSPAPNQIVH